MLAIICLLLAVRYVSSCVFANTGVLNVGAGAVADLYAVIIGSNARAAVCGCVF